MPNLSDLVTEKSYLKFGSGQNSIYAAISCPVEISHGNFFFFTLQVAAVLQNTGCSVLCSIQSSCGGRFFVDASVRFRSGCLTPPVPPPSL